MEKYSLAGVDRSASGIILYVWKVMSECGFSGDDKIEYKKKALSSGYDNLIYVSREMIDKCNKIISGGKK